MNVKDYVAIVITTLWAVSAIVDMILNNYTTPIEIHLLMGTISGYFFAKQIIRGKT